MRTLLFSLVCLVLFIPSSRADEPSWTRKEDIIYGRKHGVALTMDVFTPKQNANGAGVIMCVSGGFFSSKAAINPLFFGEALNRGYTVFAVVHGSQPKYTIPEIANAARAAGHDGTFAGSEKGAGTDRA